MQLNYIANASTRSASGRTIAVIGSGLGRLYPPENKALADRIESTVSSMLGLMDIEADPIQFYKLFSLVEQHRESLFGTFRKIAKEPISEKNEAVAARLAHRRALAAIGHPQATDIRPEGGAPTKCRVAPCNCRLTPCWSDAPVAIKPRRPPRIAPRAGPSRG